MEHEYMTITDQNGKELKCKILFTYESKEFNHSYVVFQVEETNELTAMMYTENDTNSGTLSPITDDAEWDMLQEVVESYIKEHENDHEDGCGCDCGSCHHSCGECCEGDEDEDCHCHDEGCHCSCGE